MPASLAPDVISYLSIGRDYAAGRWGEAINGYWGPLMSWLLAPLLAMHMADSAAIKGGGISWRAGGLRGVSSRSRRDSRCAGLRAYRIGHCRPHDNVHDAGHRSRPAAREPSCCFTWRYCSDPDMRIRSGLPCYAAYLARWHISQRATHSFFSPRILHWQTSLFWLRSHGPGRKQVVKNSMRRSCRVRHPQRTLDRRDQLERRQTCPQHVGSIQLPPGWTPVAGVSVRCMDSCRPPPPQHQRLGRSAGGPSSTMEPAGVRKCLPSPTPALKRNAARIALYLMHVSPLLILILPAYILYSIKRDGHWFDEWVVPAMTLFLYPAGYLLVTVEDRYLYLMAFLLLLMAFRAYDGIVGKTDRSRRVLRLGLGIVLVASFCITPVRTLAKPCPGATQSRKRRSGSPRQTHCTENSPRAVVGTNRWRSRIGWDCLTMACWARRPRSRTGAHFEPGIGRISVACGNPGAGRPATSGKPYRLPAALERLRSPATLVAPGKRDCRCQWPGAPHLPPGSARELGAQKCGEWSAARRIAAS